MNRQQWIAETKARTWSREHLLGRLFAARHLTETGCWEYRGALVKGYWYMGIGDDHRYAHRVSYELLVGPIPEKMDIDHLCRNTACFNPEHLEPVSHMENVMRGELPSMVTYLTDVCKRGHSMADAYVRPDRGTRRCRQCQWLKDHEPENVAKQRERDRARRARGERKR